MKNTGIISKFFYIILAGFIGYFYYVHFKNAHNFPYFDEYRTIATVVINFITAQGFLEKLKVLFVNENESLQLLLKIVNLTTFSIFGQIRFDIMGYIGQLSLLSFPIVIYMMNKKSPTLWFELGLTVFIIFNLQYYALTFRHDTSFYYHVGLLGVLFSSYFWVKEKYIPALVFFLIGIFNNTSSLLILPVFVLDYIFFVKSVKRKYIIIGLAAFIVLLGFFYTLNHNLFYLTDTPEVTLKSFLILMGNYVQAYVGDQNENPYFYAGGAYLLTLFTILFYYLRYYKEKNNETRFYFILILYFFITIVVIAIKRSVLYHHLASILDSRYKMFTFSLMLFLIILASKIFKEYSRFLRLPVLLVLFLYNLYYAVIIQNYVRFLNDGGKINSLDLKLGIDVLGPTYPGFATGIYHQLDSLGIKLPLEEKYLNIYNFLKKEDIDFEKTAKLTGTITSSKVEAHEHFFTNIQFLSTAENKNSCIFMKSEDGLFLFPIDFFEEKSFKEFIKTSEYFGNNFEATIYISELKDGLYDLGVATEHKDKSYSYKIFPEKIAVDESLRLKAE